MKILKFKYFILFIFPVFMFAQVNTYSPYSFFGVGNLAPSGFTQQLCTGGLGNAFFDTNHLNFSNPSSYSFLNLTTVELSGMMHINTLTQGDLTQNNVNSNITALGLGFPISKKASMAFGLKPYSFVGYNIETQLNNNSLGLIDYKFLGSGGLNNAIFGLSYAISDKIFIGTNLNYYFGTINQTNAIEFDSVGFLNYREQASTIIRDLKFDFGVGFQQSINDYNLSVGMVFSPSVDMNGKTTIFSNTYTLSGDYEYFGDTISDYTVRDGYVKMPNFLGFGINLSKGKNWLLGIDYNYTTWNDYSSFGEDITYMDNLNTFILGGYWVPKLSDIHNYWNTVQYRFGLSFSKGYLDLNYLADLDMQSPLLKDYTISLGLGLPIPKNLSEANIGFQYGFRGTKDNNLIHEKYFNIIFSITFNDKWFTKRKID